MKTPNARLALIAATAAVVALAVGSVAQATTATGHQDPHLKVVSSLLPTKPHVGDTLHASITVTNTSSKPGSVSISWEFDTPTSGSASAMSPITIKPSATWTHRFSQSASRAGSYRLVIQASDAKGTSKATATASAG